MNDDRSFLGTLIGDGRALLELVALVLIGSGAFALFQAATGHFLPHDTAYLGMTSQQLCSLHGCRIVHFMMHDRVSFGGVLIAIALMYLWLIEFPMRRGEAWAWWAIVISGVAGFLSFLTYLGYGYLDTWHGVSTLALLPLYVWGLARTWKLLPGGRTSRPPTVAADETSALHAVPARGWRVLLTPGEGMSMGRALLLLATLGIVGAGLTIMTVGMTTVFVPQDIEYMGLDAAQMRAINANLIPLIAHDRAGFGGGLASCGLAMLVAVWCAPMSKSLWQALFLAGIAGFATAIGIHPVIGYTSISHLAPAVAGSVMFFIGLMIRTWKPRLSATPATRSA
ncbi:MAG TPA: hypothetical protein VNA69_08625 [Thermoanaerobaculia bacterium]|nr:hypothetical protein [Thermoanaerobaculia bacterium]